MKFMNVIKKFASKADMVEYRNSMLDEAEKLLGEGADTVCNRAGIQARDECEASEGCL